MTRVPNSDPSRQTIVGNVATTATYFATAPHTITHLRGAIDARIEDGLRAASYEAPTSGGGGGSVAERSALGHCRRGCPDPGGEGCTCPDRNGDQACEDLGDLDRALGLWAEGDAIIERLRKWYPLSTPMPKTGDGPCPAGLCADHWEAGIRRSVSAKRYARFCRRCGDHRQTHGHGIPPLVLKAAHDAGRRTGKADDWQHWTVARAWSSLPPMEMKPAESTEPDAVTSTASATSA